MHETSPVEIVHMPPRAGPHETGGHRRLSLELVLVVEFLPVDEPPRPRRAFRRGPSCCLSGLGEVRFLNDEPFGKLPSADPEARKPGRGRRGRWSVQPRRRNVGQQAEKTGQPRIDYLVQVVCGGPGLQAADDGGVFRQVDESARSVGGDHLAVADLALCSAAHPSPSDSEAVKGRMRRLTSGSTSRSDRLARNLA